MKNKTVTSKNREGRVIREATKKVAAKVKTPTPQISRNRLTALVLGLYVAASIFAGGNVSATHFDAAPAANFNNARADDFTNALNRLKRIAESPLATREELQAARKELEQVSQGLRHSEAFVIRAASQDQAFVKGLRQTISERGAARLATEFKSDPARLSAVPGARTALQRIANDMGKSREAIRAAAATIPEKPRAAREQSLQRMRQSVQPKSGARNLFSPLHIRQAVFTPGSVMEFSGTRRRTNLLTTSSEQREARGPARRSGDDRPVLGAIQPAPSASCYDAALRDYDACRLGAEAGCDQACVQACREGCDANPLVFDKNGCKEEFCRADAALSLPCELGCEAAQQTACAAKLIADEAGCISSDVEQVTAVVVGEFQKIVVQGKATLSELGRALFGDECVEGLRCFGALGMDCGAPVEGLKVKVALCGPGGCLINGGSWEHDECCAEHPAGMACRRGPFDAALGHDGNCVREWDKAVTLAALGLNWFRRLDTNKCNASGRVVFSEYCALKGSLVHKDDVQYCCSRTAVTLDQITQTERTALGPALAAIGDTAQVRVCN
jgi:hypothetical protein